MKSYELWLKIQYCTQTHIAYTYISGHLPCKLKMKQISSSKKKKNHENADDNVAMSSTKKNSSFAHIQKLYDRNQNDANVSLLPQHPEPIMFVLFSIYIHIYIYVFFPVYFIHSFGCCCC